MAGTNRVGRVSSIDYESGTYEVTYADQGRRVTARINAMSNGEYKMPRVGQIVSVTHTSNGTAAATTSGTVWNRSNRPAEGFAGLYRKEYGEKAGQAFERYDANTGIYTQYTDVRTGRNCNGDIFDEAKGTISLIAEKLVQITSKIKSVSIHGKEGVGIGAEKSVTIDAGENINLEAEGDLDEGAGGDRALTVGGLFPQPAVRRPVPACCHRPGDGGKAGSFAGGRADRRVGHQSGQPDHGYLPAAQ